MYKVIVVDDEPAACRHISMIIEKYCRNFQVVAVEDNGMDAMSKIQKFDYDVLITDVCMPLMDGIELIEKMDQEGKSLKTIVTSGYQEFDYVQKAINLGASSYLLKPVVPNSVIEVLKKIEVELDRDYIHMQINLFNALYHSESYDEKLVSRVFTYDFYYLAVRRLNGLPMRHRQNNFAEMFAEKSQSIIIYGRDVDEELYFIPEELVKERSLIRIVEDESNLEIDKGYYTLVYFNHPMKVEDFFVNVKKLYHILDSSLAIGQSQSLTVKEAAKINEPQIGNSYTDDLERLYYYIREKEAVRIRKELNKLFDCWKKDKRTQLYMEALTKQILYRMRQSYGNRISFLESEQLVDEMFAYSKSMNDFKVNYLDIIDRFYEDENFVDKIDTPEFFEKVLKYLNGHIDQQISLNDLCKKFGVSQAYLSKMFRKYIDESYNQYSTRIRIDKAKHIMTHNPEMRVKDVAAMVGYGDQFYFSRIFRTYMHITPTDFIGQIKLNEK